MIRRRDLAWGVGAQALNVGSGLVLLPFMVRALPSDELGLWYLFLTLGALAQLLDLGFQPTIARQVAYAHAGAGTLQPRGLPARGSKLGTEPPVLDAALYADLFFSARAIYRALTLGVAAGLAVGGGAYLAHVSRGALPEAATLAAWAIYAAGAAVQFSAGRLGGFLQGRGEITTTNRWAAISRALFVAGAVPALLVGAGLLGVAACSAMAAVFYNVALRRAFFARPGPETQALRAAAGHWRPSLVKPLWHGAWRLGAVQFGAFLILRANLFVASLFLGLGAVAQYGLTIQVLGLLATTAGIIASLQLPRMNVLQAHGDRAGLREAFSTGVVGGAGVYLAGALVVAGPATWLLAQIGSRTRLVEEPLLLVALGIYFLEFLHSLSASYLTTLNQVPFLGAALLSGIGIVVVSALLLKTTSLGLAALLLSQGLVQLAYNNWKWPRDALRHLGLAPAAALRLGLGGVLRLVHPR